MTTAVASAAVDPFSAEHRDDPFPAYHALREQGRVVWSDEHEAYFLTHYEDCVELLRHPAGSVDSDNAPRTGRRAAALDGPMAAIQGKPMLFSDQPDHTRLRGLVSKAFTPRAIEGLRPHIADVVDRLLDAAEERGSMDVVADLAFPLPVIVIAELLGVPVEDQDQLKPWSRDLARTIDPVVTEETASQAGMSALQFVNYLNGLIESRTASPRDDLLSGLIGNLSHEDLLIMAMLLFIAGHETTQNLIGNGLMALFRNPSEMERLRAEPDMVKNAVEEMLRYDGPVQLTGRHLLEDVVVGDVTLPAGTTAITLLGAANRDPAMFPDPDRFDIARENANRHIGFGMGIHFCLGAPLARLEAQTAIGALLRRFPDLQPAWGDAEPEHRETFTLRGLVSLPVKF